MASVPQRAKPWAELLGYKPIGDDTPKNVVVILSDPMAFYPYCGAWSPVSSKWGFALKGGEVQPVDPQPTHWRTMRENGANE